MIILFKLKEALCWVTCIVLPYTSALKPRVGEQVEWMELREVRANQTARLLD
jgi:hypothetical protein